LSNDKRSESNHKIIQEEFAQDTWAGEGGWRIIHRILGAIVLMLGIVNISLGVFLAVLPLAVWVIWFVYMSILILILITMEILAFVRGGGTRKGGSLKLPGKTTEKFLKSK
jgi:sensor histidine kinase YesM